MEILLLWPLLILIRSDFRERQVRLFVLLLFGVIQWGICAWQTGIMILLLRIGENLLLLVVWGLCTAVYFWLRNCFSMRKNRGYVGKGDIVFILCLLPVFPLCHFLLFIMLALFFALLYWILRGMSLHDTIPFVSMLGICYLPILILHIYG